MPKMVRFTVDEHGVFRLLPMAREWVRPFNGWPTTAETGGNCSRNEQGRGKVWFTSNGCGQISKAGPYQPSEETAGTLHHPRRVTPTTRKRRLPHHVKHGGARGLKLRRLMFRSRLQQARVSAKGTVLRDGSFLREDDLTLKTGEAGEAVPTLHLGPQRAEPNLPEEFESKLVLYSFSL